MVSRLRAWVDAGNHNDLRLIFGHKRVSQDHGEFRSPERDMAACRIQSPDALLQSEEGLVDFGAFKSSLSIVRLAIGCALRTREIDQKKFPASLVPDFDAN